MSSLNYQNSGPMRTPDRVVIGEIFHWNGRVAPPVTLCSTRDERLTESHLSVRNPLSVLRISPSDRRRRPPPPLPFEAVVFGSSLRRRNSESVTKELCAFQLDEEFSVDYSVDQRWR